MSSLRSKISSSAPTESASQDASAGFTRLLVGGMVALVVLTIALRTFVMESCPVLGPSMEPTLNDGERVLVWKLPVVLSRLPLIGGHVPLDPGDLVVFQRPEERGRRYVKRVIAEGAQSDSDPAVQVVFEKGRVFVDNQAVDEPYLTPEERDSPIDFHATLQPGQLFVLGDHRSVSKDSLRFGPIQEEQVIGRPFLRVWPLSKAGWL